MSSPIRLVRPDLDARALGALERVLASGMLVQGAEVARFEAAIAERAERAHGIAVSSGTSALELALRALGVGPGDEVLVPDLTWPSPAHAAALVGASPRVVDVDAAEWNAGADTFAAARTARTRAAIVIDQFGMPARHLEVAAALDALPIVEDAACAIGSALAGRPAGSFGVLSCLSFHPRKVLTTGEGGMVLTDDAALATELRTLRNHGQVKPGVFEKIGANHRLGELAAALGMAQLGELDAGIDKRQAIAARYVEGLAAIDPALRTQQAPAHARWNVQTFGVVLPSAWSADDRDALLAAIGAAQVEVGRLSYALHRLPNLARFHPARCETSASIVDRGLALPMHAGLSADDVTTVLSAFERGYASTRTRGSQSV